MRTIVSLDGIEINFATRKILRKLQLTVLGRKLLINKQTLLVSHRKCIENSVENMNSDVRV